MEELSIFPPRGESEGAACHRCHSGKESTNGVNLHICFSENIRFRVLMKNGTFLCKIKNFLQVNRNINYGSLYTHINIYIYLILTQPSICQPAGRLADGRHKSHTKNVFFRKKNAVGRATFVGWPIKLAGLIIHV